MSISGSSDNLSFKITDVGWFKNKKELKVTGKNLPSMIFRCKVIDQKTLLEQTKDVHYSKPIKWVEVTIENKLYYVKIKDIQKYGFSILNQGTLGATVDLEKNLNQITTSHVIKNLIKGGLSKEDALKIALYLLEGSHSNDMRARNSYKKKEDTGLPFTLESINGKIFVLIKGKSMSIRDHIFSKYGVYKRVTRAINIETGEVMAHHVINVDKIVRKTKSDKNEIINSIKFEFQCLKKFGGYNPNDLYLWGRHQANKQGQRNLTGDDLITFITPIAKETATDLPKENLTSIELLNGFKSIFNQLKTMHNQGYVHHDVKPDNILIYENNEWKLNDFGLAKKADEKSFGGTLLFCPLDFNTIETKTKDLYAFALTMCAIFLGGTHHIDYAKAMGKENYVEYLLNDLKTKTDKDPIGNSIFLIVDFILKNYNNKNYGYVDLISELERLMCIK
jgi:hypothetical protein